ncbi:peptidoglycan recognition protein family protein [Pelotomaculum propionicicum]|uniref:N-acetylmuramoyl-L-alanine amidase n=1 Tax=Pelotomaculum propionicicum TaxID=258475 RepID=A0A4Y7RT30_9FIRM|nr:N-acetylmuramoyl-L-alanine amidase [Pelotomaculum propionicicum]NLI13928.1 hypothetical protein [Peptococcaceae bacterium]TEB12031.1 Bifunctional autolysin [Pelotomaculum propionicicum]
MQEYEIIQDFLQLGREYNRPGTELVPQGLTVHETATPGATSNNESAYFHNAYREASAHFFVDYSAIVQIIPEDEVAWHAGPTANRRFLSVELCHFTDPEKFQEVWKRGVWLASMLCRKYQWEPSNMNQLNSHAWVSEQWGETDHTDPVGYFQMHGRTWEDFVNDVAKNMQGVIEPMAKLIEKEPWKIEQGIAAIKNLSLRGILVEPDQHIAKLKDADENSLDWVLFVGLDRIAEKAGIKKE